MSKIGPHAYSLPKKDLNEDVGNFDENEIEGSRILLQKSNLRKVKVSPSNGKMQGQ